ncbi:GNAT family N-acetyltransferase [Streptomyces sp. NRRL S-378]|uniref:GNAT family N-acetyltransferase n=1 Tax=Streptomyces sp. NRRL S-378 TaxID=1463904 RepID=UPI0004CB5CF3|nr:GNAT family N-acetyltransferase [Streptomyces sp. NRRL S-378]
MTEAPWRIEADPEPGACADLLAAAFAREPAVTWICGGSVSARTHWFRNTVRTHAGLAGARRTALSDADGRLLAAAVLTPPGATPSAGARALWAARTLLRSGPRALGRTLRYLGATEGGAPAGAWTLEFIGVRPALTGRGAGRALLDHVLSAVPAEAGVCLTTADPSNVGLYRHFGFSPLGEAEVGPLTVTSMARRNR